MKYVYILESLDSKHFRVREIPEVGLRPGICEEASVMLKAFDAPHNLRKTRP